MVIYNPSQNTRTIKVITPEVDTSLTIDAPAEVIAGEPFLIEGTLSRTDLNIGLSGETILLSHVDLTGNWVSLGTATTGGLAGSIKYQKETSISVPSEIPYVLKAEFTGSTRSGLSLGASNALASISLELSQNVPLMIAATAILGTILMAFGLSK